VTHVSFDLTNRGKWCPLFGKMITFFHLFVCILTETVVLSFVKATDYEQ